MVSVFYEGVSPAEKAGVALSLLAPSYVGELKQTVQSLTQKTTMINLITTSKTIAIISFIIGTTLFALQLYNPKSDAFFRIGALFIIIATIVNTIALATLIFSLLGSSKIKTEILKTISIVLLNIPIAFLYFRILIKSL